MDLKDKMGKFNKRWNILQEETPEEAFKKFKIRILNIFDDIDDHLTEESVSQFCQFYGIIESWESNDYSGQKWSTNVIDRLKKESSLVEFYKLLEIIFSLNIRETQGYYVGAKNYNKQILLRSTIEALDYSSVNAEISVTQEGEVIFYPRGEKELDEQLVNYPLSFLGQKSGNHFIEALKFYQSKKAIKSVDSLRRSLEEFLREKLNNNTGLKENISELQKKLKSDGRDAQVRNIFGSIFNYLDQYFNENSKHKDGNINEAENEFIIYQVGVIMRYLHKAL